MAIIDRSGTSALMPEEVSRTIVQSVPESSAILALARRLPNMSRKQSRMPVLASMVQAYFVNGDTGLKKTTQMAWDNKYINAEEIAAIIPIPEAVLDDADYDIWGEVQPRIVEAMGAAIDGAIIFGENAPSAWPQNLLDGAAAAGNNVALGTGTDMYDDILSESGVYDAIETDGYMVTGNIAAIQMRAKMRGLRDADGNPLFRQLPGANMTYVLDGNTVLFPRNGAFDVSQALMLSGDFEQLVYSIRQDITYKMLDQAVLQDAAGNIIHNLAQQDMVALRVVFRMGWQLPNPINRLQLIEANRYPFGFLTP